ncbi:MAG: mandelate racemase/muconate lactonizing enzyme family protein [Bryobacteraceae bacterium]|nr:mandelate racemase/muconate lactonizing enzyme family protein [Bryobacteraceae bacterium]
MRTTRRRLLQFTAAAAAAPAAAAPLGPALASAMEGPVLKTELFPNPAPIDSIDLLKAGRHYLVRVRGGGLTGYSEAHSSVMSVAYPILLKRVIPNFVKKDARQLERIFGEAYVAQSNYKWQGLPFWVSMAAVEIAILDLLGQAAKKPLGELLGTVTKREIGVYRASGNRGNAPEAEIDYLKKIAAEDGAAAIKYRLGARMRYNDASTRRDLALIELTRKTFGEKMTIYADANGSYDVPMALRIGRAMEATNHRFFEEPAPFDYYDETREIAAALKIPIALGEEEMSLRGFRRIIEHRIADIVQPDLMYFGGMIRSIKVARMAAAAGMECTPHMSGGGLGYLYVAHFASCVPNAGPHQEYKGMDGTLPVECATAPLKSVNGKLTVPTGPGLGVTIDPDFLKRAEVVRG